VPFIPQASLRVFWHTSGVSLLDEIKPIWDDAKRAAAFEFGALADRIGGA
jgi:hypothetical protein